jgi:hypothetical protein
MPESKKRKTTPYIPPTGKGWLHSVHALALTIEVTHPL